MFLLNDRQLFQLAASLAGAIGWRLFYFITYRALDSIKPRGKSKIELARYVSLITEQSSNQSSDKLEAKWLGVSLLDYFELSLVILILTDKRTHFNRPDITLINKSKQTALDIDIAIPSTHKLLGNNIIILLRFKE